VGEAIGQMLPFAVGVALSTMPIVAIVLMLLTPKAVPNGLSFLAGWVVGITVAGTIVLRVVAPSSTSNEGAPADWTFWLKVVLGVLLLLVGIKHWRVRPAGDDEVPLPKWMGALEGFTPVKAAGMAFLLSAMNPKNLIFIVGGATAVAQTAISGNEQAIAWAIFAIIASVGVAAPVVIYFAMGDRAADRLGVLKTWMVHNNATIMAGLILVIGVKLIGDGISGLSV